MRFYKKNIVISVFNDCCASSQIIHYLVKIRLDGDSINAEYRKYTPSGSVSSSN